MSESIPDQILQHLKGIPIFDRLTDEELEISRSTPAARFDVASAPAPEPEAPVTDAPEDALEFLDRATHDPDNPVVLFALEWCEFCWSVRKMFAHYEIPYRAVDLDSVAYQKDDQGGKIRKAIEVRTGLKTIPQIFVGGEHIGGATEVFDAFRDGRLQKLLEANDVGWNRSSDQDPYSFLPRWLHPR